MGNASKALVIAGGILISVLVISICMYMYTSFKSAYSANMMVHDAVQREAFNSFFIAFSDEITGWEAYNICGKINEIKNDPDALTVVTLESTVLDLDTYKIDTFYFTESLTKNTYIYSYSDTNSDGIIDKVYISD